jgi:glutaredoxin 3
MIFSKSYCPYCTKAKKLIQSLNVQYDVLELDQVENGGEIQDYLYEITKQKTVPNIFVQQKHVGGCDAIHSLHSSGKLQSML